MRTPNYNEGYDHMDIDEDTPQNHLNARVNEFSL